MELGINYKIKSLLIILGLHLLLLLLTPFTAWPEMLFWPYLLLNGWLPYENIAIAHTPLLLIDLSAFYALFGVGLTQLKIYTYIVILLTDILLFFVAEKIWNRKVAVASLLTYLPLQIFYDGNGLWFDILLAPYALIIFYFLTNKEFFWSGVFAVLAFLTKQTAVWFAIPIIYHLLIQNKANIKVVKKFLGASWSIVLMFTLILLIFGILDDFYFWGLQFGVTTLPMSQGQISLPTVKEFLYALFPFVIFGFLLLQKNKYFLVLSLWVFAGMLGVYPRWELFHFQPALPFVALALGIVINEFNKDNKLMKSAVSVFLILLFVIFSLRIFRLTDNSRFFEHDTLLVAKTLDERTMDGSEIYIINAWDNIYVLSNTIPAINPWIPHFSWYMEISGIQEEIVSDLENSRPQYIIIQPFTKAGLSSYRPKQVVDFIEENYELESKVGRYEILIQKK